MSKIQLFGPRAVLRTRYRRSVKPPSRSKAVAWAANWRSSRLHATAMSTRAALAASSGNVDEVDGVDFVDDVDGFLRWLCTQPATSSAVLQRHAIKSARRASSRVHKGRLRWRRKSS